MSLGKVRPRGPGALRDEQGHYSAKRWVNQRATLGRRRWLTRRVGAETWSRRPHLDLFIIRDARREGKEFEAPGASRRPRRWDRRPLGSRRQDERSLLRGRMPRRSMGKLVRTASLPRRRRRKAAARTGREACAATIREGRPADVCPRVGRRPGGLARWPFPHTNLREGACSAPPVGELREGPLPCTAERLPSGATTGWAVISRAPNTADDESPTGRRMPASPRGGPRRPAGKVPAG